MALFAFRVAISDELKRVMEQSGLSHYKIAKESGVSQPTITRFLNGTRSLTLESADKLCDFFQLHLVENEPSEGAKR